MPDMLWQPYDTLPIGDVYRRDAGVARALLRDTLTHQRQLRGYGYNVADFETADVTGPQQFIPIYRPVRAAIPEPFSAGDLTVRYSGGRVADGK